MAEIKGMFISLCGRLMGASKELEAADSYLFKETGKHYNELDPEGWYDTKFYSQFMEEFAKTAASGNYAIVILGKRVYPSIKKQAICHLRLRHLLNLFCMRLKDF